VRLKYVREHDDNDYNAKSSTGNRASVAADDGEARNVSKGAVSEFVRNPKRTGDPNGIRTLTSDFALLHNSAANMS
jgi:hypothetical protein